MSFIYKLFPFLNFSSNAIGAFFVLTLIISFTVAVFYLKRRMAYIKKALSEDALEQGTRFDSFWKGYKDTFIYAKNNSKYTSENAEIYINEHHLLYSGLNLRLINNISNLLVGFGILGTFTGLTYGIADSNFENTEAIKTSINQLLTGMGTAFVTSIWGMFLSLLFSIYYKILQNDVSNKVLLFAQELDNLYLIKGKKKQDLEGVRTKENIETVIKEYFALENEEGFLEKPSTTLNGLLTESHKHTQSLATLSDDLALSLEDALEKLIEANTSEISRILEDKLVPILEDLKNVKEESGSEMIESIILRLESSMKSMLSEFKDSVSSESREEMERLTSRLSSVSEVLVNLPSALDNMTSEISESIEIIKETVKEDIAKSSQIANQQREESLSIFSRSIKEFENIFDALNSNTANILETQSENIVEVQRSIEAIKSLLIDNSAINEQFRIIFNKAESVSENLGIVSSKFELNAEHLDGISERFGIVIADLSEHMEEANSTQTTIVQGLSTTSQEILSLSREYSEKFVVIEKGLGSIFEQIQSGLKDYSEATATTLNTQLLEFSSALEPAVNGLKEAAFQLTDRLNDMEDILEAAKDE